MAGKIRATTYDWNGHSDLGISYPHLTDEQMAGTTRMLFRDSLDHEGVVCGARDRIMALAKAFDRQQAALDRIRARLAGEWFDPTGDLESDLAKVLRELDGTAEADEPEDSNDNPFDPESTEGRAWDRGEMNPDGGLKTPSPAPKMNLEGVYVIPREMTDEEWREVKYNVDRKSDPDIPLWRIQEAVRYADFIAGHRGLDLVRAAINPGNC